MNITIRLLHKCCWLVCLGIVATGCTEQIDVNPFAGSPQIVIQGRITDQEGMHFIAINTSSIEAYTSLNYKNYFKPVNNAEVSIDDGLGNIENLVPLEAYTTDTSKYYAADLPGKGIYHTHNKFRGIAGRTYTLTVKHQGQVYRATATMPAPVTTIDQVSYTPFNTSNANNQGWAPLVSFDEPQNQKNYYQFFFGHGFNKNNFDGYKGYLGNHHHLRVLTFDSYYIFDDKFWGTRVNDLLLKEAYPHLYPPSGIVGFQLHSINQDAYNYFSALKKQAEQRYWQNKNKGGIFDVAPASPPTNISNGALGFFTVASVSKLDVSGPIK